MLGWRGTRQAVGGAVFVVLLLFLMRYLDRYRPLLRFRARRARAQAQAQAQAHARVHFTNHLNRESQAVAVDFPSESSDSFSTRDSPPSYFECSEPARVPSPVEPGNPDEPPPPYVTVAPQSDTFPIFEKVRPRKAKGEGPGPSSVRIDVEERMCAVETVQVPSPALPAGPRVVDGAPRGSGESANE